MAMQYFDMQIWNNLFNKFTIDGHVCCFQSVSMTRQISMNIHEQLFP